MLGACAEAEAVPPDRAEDEDTAAGARAGVFAPSDRPGATAETSAANPAVNPAVATISHRRVRPIRARAASRWRTASEGLG